MTQAAARHLRVHPGHFNPIGTGGVDGQDSGCSEYSKAFFYFYAHDVFPRPTKKRLLNETEEIVGQDLREHGKELDEWSCMTTS